MSRMLRVVDGFFPSGAPISSPAFLAGLIKLIDADSAAITLVRHDPRRKALVTFDSHVHNFHGDRYVRHLQNLTNQRAWDKDPVAHRLLWRSTRRPGSGYTFSSRRWIRRFGWKDSFSNKMLDAAGWQSNVTAMVPLEKRTFALISLARLERRDFGRIESRMLYYVSRIFQSRVVDMRARKLRDELPQSIRQTFDLILSGVSEKEIAHLTRRKSNTIHDQVKRLYTHFSVSSRAQLMAKFIDAGRLKDHRV